MHVASMGNRRVSYRILASRHEGKSPLGRHRNRFEDTIKRDLQEVGGGGMDWIDLVQGTDKIL